MKSVEFIVASPIVTGNVYTHRKFCNKTTRVNVLQVRPHHFEKGGSCVLNQPVFLGDFKEMLQLKEILSKRGVRSNSRKPPEDGHVVNREKSK